MLVLNSPCYNLIFLQLISRDAITPNQNFIISHGYKFLPIIGKYVVRMLDGTLEKEAADRWAWDKEMKVLLVKCTSQNGI